MKLTLSSEMQLQSRPDHLSHLKTHTYHQETVRNEKRTQIWQGKSLYIDRASKAGS